MSGFFSGLFDLSAGLDINIHVKRVGERLTLAVIPVAGGVVPVTMTGTPEELDAEFMDHLRPVMDKVGVVLGNVALLDKDLEQMEADKKDEVAGAGKKTDATKKAAPVKKAAPAKEPEVETKKAALAKKPDIVEKVVAAANKVVVEETIDMFNSEV